VSNATLTNVVALVHLVVLAMWGGVVATEAVVETTGHRRSELTGAASRFHYWIDLLVELPLVVAVIATGASLLWLVEDITDRHLVKLAFAASAVAVNVACIVVVLRRERGRRAGAPPEAQRAATRVVLACFAIGLACAAVAAVLGFSLGMARMR
jgi:hypothetical protein